MNYVVTVFADGASSDQLESAKELFCSTLESSLDGVERIPACLLAWGKSKEDLKALTDQEVIDVAAWLRAAHAAESVARAPLHGNGTFLVRLHPS